MSRSTRNPSPVTDHITATASAANQRWGPDIGRSPRLPSSCQTGRRLNRLISAAHRAMAARTGQPVASDDQTSREAIAQSHLRGLTANSREALLLRTIEELRYDQIAKIMQIDQEEAEELVQIALNEMGRAIRGRVMIIEDETIIAMDLKGIVQAMGHEVTGVARTHTAAVELAGNRRPEEGQERVYQQLEIEHGPFRRVVALGVAESVELVPHAL